jgi:hypothetical protein
MGLIDKPDPIVLQLYGEPSFRSSARRAKGMAKCSRRTSTAPA